MWVHKKQSKKVITIKLKINSTSKGQNFFFDQEYLFLMLLGADNFLFLDLIGSYVTIHLKIILKPVFMLCAILCIYIKLCHKNVLLEMSFCLLGEKGLQKGGVDVGNQVTRLIL